MKDIKPYWQKDSEALTKAYESEGKRINIARDSRAHCQFKWRVSFLVNGLLDSVEGHASKRGYYLSDVEEVIADFRRGYCFYELGAESK